MPKQSLSRSYNKYGHWVSVAMLLKVVWRDAETFAGMECPFDLSLGVEAPNFEAAGAAVPPAAADALAPPRAA